MNRHTSCLNRSNNLYYLYLLIFVLSTIFSRLVFSDVHPSGSRDRILFIYRATMLRYYVENLIQFFIGWKCTLEIKLFPVRSRCFPFWIPLTIYQHVLNTIDLRQSRFQGSRGTTPIVVDVSLTGFSREPNRATLVNVACRRSEFQAFHILFRLLLPCLFHQPFQPWTSLS